MPTKLGYNHVHAMVRSQSDSLPPPSFAGEGTRKRARVACRQCRQAKIRCGLKEIPCDRCQRLALDCSIDPAYRRTTKRDEVRELLHQVQTLQGFIENRSDAATGVAILPNSPVRTNARQRESHDSQDGPRESTSPSAMSMRTGDLPGSDFLLDSTPTVRTLGNIQLSQDRAKFMFATYFARYHAFLPILDASRDESTTYESSPLLFWSIISVSARQLRSKTNILSNLAPDLNQLLWATVASGTLKLPQIQALLLLACWPLPDMRLWTDKSILLGNIAMTSAMHLGFHRPGCELEYAKEPLQLSQSDVMERFRTWIAAAVLCQSLSLDLGQGPSPHFEDWSIRSIRSISTYSDLPVELRNGLVIQDCIHDARLKLSKAAEGPYGIPGGSDFSDIIWQCEKLFDRLPQSANDQFSLTNWLELQNARLDIQCLYLLQDTPSEARLAGILRAYSTASDIIARILSDETSHDVLPYAPLRISRMIFRAAILRVLHSTSSAGLDYTNGRLLVNAAAFSLRQFSAVQNDKDQPIRASEMLRAFWRAAERSPTMSSQRLTLRAKSRMGASVVYDCLLRFRDTRATTTTATTTVSTQQMEARPDVASESLMPVANELIGHTAPQIPNTTTTTTVTAFPDPPLFTSDVLNPGLEVVDMANLAWLEDIEYPSFGDLETW